MKGKCGAWLSQAWEAEQAKTRPETSSVDSLDIHTAGGPGPARIVYQYRATLVPAKWTEPTGAVRRRRGEA
jgi:hypothetical protein